MHTIKLMTVVLVAQAFAYAAVDPFRPVARVELSDGRVLTNFRVMAYTSDGIDGKWEGGNGVVAYDQFPSDWGAVIAQFRPKTRTESSVVASGGAQKSGATADRNRSQPKKRAYVGDEQPPAAPKPNLTPISDVDSRYSTTVLPTTVTGQCFIVTKGGVSYKLGDVAIKFYPVEQYLKWIKKIDEQIAPVLTALERRYQWFDRRNDNSGALTALNETIALRRLGAQLLPPPPFQAVTDADGRFSIAHKLARPFVVVASARRLVGKETEYYEWTIFSDKIPENAPLLLTNSNLQ